MTTSVNPPKMSRSAVATLRTIQHKRVAAQAGPAKAKTLRSHFNKHLKGLRRRALLQQQPKPSLGRGRPSSGKPTNKASVTSSAKSGPAKAKAKA